MMKNDENVRWLPRREPAAGLRPRAGTMKLLALSGTVCVGLVSLGLWGTRFIPGADQAMPVSELTTVESRQDPEPEPSRPVAYEVTPVPETGAAPAEVQSPIFGAAGAAPSAPIANEDGDDSGLTEGALETGSLLDGPAGGTSQAPSTPWSRAVASGALVVGPETPSDCLPTELTALMTDLAEKLGPVTVVSTTHLHTDNHLPGSSREQSHHACKAIDIKVSGRSDEVMAYLKSRPEVSGLNRYRNGVIHIDTHEQ